MTIWDRRTVPPVAVALLERVEGTRLRAYRDGGGVWTIGTGSTFMPSGRRVQAGDAITEPQAAALLAIQCERWVTVVADAITVPLEQAQAAVLISFTHNLGPNALAGSMVAKMANAGRLDLAGNQLNGWVVSAGQRVLGLERRREYERRLFAAEVAEGLAAYGAVWAIGEAVLLPLYQRAFAEARAWGWGAETPIGKPVAQQPTTVTTADLNDASAAGTLDIQEA